MTESKPFTFAYDGHTFTAYVRYHEDGDWDVELVEDFNCAEAYDIAWQVAESLGLMPEPLDLSEDR